MARRVSRAPVWLVRGVSLAGLAVFFYGAHWLWRLRYIWPRTLSDPVPHLCLEAIAVMIVGLFLVSRGR